MFVVFGYACDGFIIIDFITNIVSSNIDHCFSYVTSYTNVEINVCMLDLVK